MLTAIRESKVANDTSLWILKEWYSIALSVLPRSADVKGAKVALAPVLEDMVRIETILADQSYRGSLAEVLAQAHHCLLTITEKLGEGLITIGDSTLLIATAVRSTRTLPPGDGLLRELSRGSINLVVYVGITRYFLKITRL